MVLLQTYTDIKAEGTRDICGIQMDHQGCLVVAGNVFDIGNVLSPRKTMALVRDNCSCCQSWSMSPPSPFCRKSTILHVHFAVYHAQQHLAFCFISTPTTRWASTKNQQLTPAALGGKQFRWAMHKPVWHERLVCFVFMLSYSTCYINCHDMYSIKCILF